ncbi:MAG: 3-phosphoshikimate 1-carboxyvinyltransferase [Bacteroidota bacterium]
MIREIRPAGPLRAVVQVPGSKSITNRALICAALAEGDSRLLNASDSDDSALLANALNQLGVLARKVPEGINVQGTGGRLFAPKFPIPVGNAGTTLRFLLSLAALAEGTTVLEGSPRMAERPNEGLIEALRNQGIAVRHEKGDIRFAVRGGALPGGDVAVHSDQSSQFMSSLLLVAPYAARMMTLRAEGEMASEPYLDLTLDVMQAFGAEVTAGGRGVFRVSNARRYRPGEFSVESDASGASYPLAAAAIAGGEVFVPGLREGSRQGDAVFAQILRSMGCGVDWREDGLLCAQGDELRGVEIDMHATPDIVPTVVAVALFAAGPTRVVNVAHLRFKESNRAEGLAEELGKLGAQVTVRDDAIEVVPAPLHGAQLDSRDDHRLAMCFALIGLRVPGVRIENPDCVRKSFPRFWEVFDHLYTHHP